MKNDDIDTNDIPELTSDFWKNARLRYPPENKEQLSVKFDEDMVQWFRAQDEDYQTKMNAVLRYFYEAHK